jgi:hypothetical protein
VAVARQSAANFGLVFSDGGFLPKAATPSPAKPGPGKTSETVIQNIFDELPGP